MTNNKKLSDLNFDTKNANKHTAKGQKALEDSLQKYGAGRSILVDKNNNIIAGNLTAEVAGQIGLEEVQIVESDGKKLIVVKRTDIDINSKAGRELAISDNRASELSLNWDSDALKDIQENFKVDLSEFFSNKELKLLGLDNINLNEENFEFADEIKTDIVLGDLFEIGEHRLLCGDSTDSDQVAKLMNGQKADMAHNDPPYGMKKEKEGVLNDNLNYSDLLDFNREWIALQFMNLKENGSWYCWGIDEPLMDIYSEILKPYIAEQKATFRNLIIWFKNPSGLGDGQNNSIARSFGIITEKCLFVMMGVQGFNNNSDNYFEGFEVLRDWLIKEKQKSGLKNEEITKLTATTHTHYWSKSQWAFPTKEHYNSIKEASNGKAFTKEYEEIKKEYEEIKKEYEEIKKEYYSTRAYFNNTHDKMTEVWQFDRHIRQGDEGGHATPKPIPLCERAIKSSCPDNGLVLDFFLGSGSTMVASHQLKRKCYGMEIDPKYCQVILDRMLKFDPTLKIVKNGKHS